MGTPCLSPYNIRANENAQQFSEFSLSGSGDVIAGMNGVKGIQTTRVE